MGIGTKIAYGKILRFPQKKQKIFAKSKKNRLSGFLVFHMEQV
jgi:hypothetical protein